MEIHSQPVADFGVRAAATAAWDAAGPAGTHGYAALANPALAALAGPDAALSERRGRVLRYAGGDVCPFVGMPDPPRARDWADLAALVGAGGKASFAVEVSAPTGWEPLARFDVRQMTGEAVTGAGDPEAVPLGPADVPEMLELVERTQPGPFLPRTVELGGYLGIRRGGRLVAMAGERMHPPGWAEISGVCTHHDHRGQGLARRLVNAVAAGVRARGLTPMLHVMAGNTGAIRLYERLGFRVWQPVTVMALRAPGGPNGVDGTGP
jgi:ribosomal protein S18 acetylase RimI-like enzyme